LFSGKNMKTGLSLPMVSINVHVPWSRTLCPTSKWRIVAKGCLPVFISNSKVCPLLCLVGKVTGALVYIYKYTINGPLSSFNC